MPNRSVLLRILFASLALAAVGGAAGILLASYDTIWRVTGTSILTAFTALLLLAASHFADRERTREAAMWAAALLVSVYLLSVAAIWEFLGNRYDEPLALSAIFVALVGIPAVGFVRMRGSRTTALAGRVGLMLAAVEMGLLLFTTWRGWEHGGMYFAGVAATLAPAGLLAVLCLVGAGAGDRRHWRWLGVACAAAAFIAYIANLVRGEDDWLPHVYHLLIAAAVVGHANVLLLFPLKPQQHWLRFATIAAAAVTGFCSAAAIALVYETGTLERLAGAAALVAGCGTLALIVLARLNKRMTPAPSDIPEIKTITIHCPVCQRKQAIPLSGGRCAGCNLLIEVRVEEPRCAACGYSLLMLKTDKCPECGAPAFPPLPPGEGIRMNVSRALRGWCVKRAR